MKKGNKFKVKGCYQERIKGKGCIVWGKVKGSLREKNKRQRVYGLKFKGIATVVTLRGKWIKFCRRKKSKIISNF